MPEYGAVVEKKTKKKATQAPAAAAPATMTEEERLREERAIAADFGKALRGARRAAKGEAREEQEAHWPAKPTRKKGEMRSSRLSIRLIEMAQPSTTASHCAARERVAAACGRERARIADMMAPMRT